MSYLSMASHHLDAGTGNLFTAPYFIISCTLLVRHEIESIFCRYHFFVNYRIFSNKIRFKITVSRVVAVI